jgi:transposase-like protein
MWKTSWPERGVIVSHETIHQWCRKFGSEYARGHRRRQGRLGDTWYLDELFVTIQGLRQYLWRAIDQDGDVIDILVQPRRDQLAAQPFFRKLLKGQEREPRRLVTDQLKSQVDSTARNPASLASQDVSQASLPPADAVPFTLVSSGGFLPATDPCASVFQPGWTAVDH